MLWKGSPWSPRPPSPLLPSFQATQTDKLCLYGFAWREGGRWPCTHSGGGSRPEWPGHGSQFRHSLALGLGASYSPSSCLSFLGDINGYHVSTGNKLSTGTENLILSHGRPCLHSRGNQSRPCKKSRVSGFEAEHIKGHEINH